MLSKEALNDFQTIWKRETGETLPDNLLPEKAEALLRFFDAIYRQIEN